MLGKLHVIDSLGAARRLWRIWVIGIVLAVSAGGILLTIRASPVWARGALISPLPKPKGFQKIYALKPPDAAIDVPFFSQRDYERDHLGNSGYTVAQKGCGLTSLAMVFKRYRIDTDPAKLNEALKKHGGFSGALLAWSNKKAFKAAGVPEIESLTRVNTAAPENYRKEIDDELDKGRPVIAYLNSEHYVVVTGREGNKYFINDPWALDESSGRNIPLEQNFLSRTSGITYGFSSIRQIVFVYPEKWWPTNGIPVIGAVQDKYFALGGSEGFLRNPTQAEQAAADSPWTTGGRYQPFEGGMIHAYRSDGEWVAYEIHGPILQKYNSLGGSGSRLGFPRSDVYSYFAGGPLVFRSDFEGGTITWYEDATPENAKVSLAEECFKAEYFDNPDLSGNPVHTRFDPEVNYVWGEGAPGPWVNVDGFSARYTNILHVGFPWFYNFSIVTDDGVRVYIGNQMILNEWRNQPETEYKFRRFLWRGDHELTIEYFEAWGEASLRYVDTAWPATPVFAANPEGSFEILPATLPDISPPIPVPTPTSSIPPSTPVPTPIPPRLSPQDTVKRFFQAMDKLDVNTAVNETIAPVPGFRQLTQVLLQTYKGILQAQELDNDFSGLQYETISNDGHDAIVRVFGVVTFRSAEDGSPVGVIDDFYAEVPVRNFIARWYIYSDLRELIQSLQGPE